MNLYRDRLKGLYVVARNFSLLACSCLTVLPGPAWLLLNKICIPFSRSLYCLTSDNSRTQEEVSFVRLNGVGGAGVMESRGDRLRRHRDQPLRAQKEKRHRRRRRPSGRGVFSGHLRSLKLFPSFLPLFHIHSSSQQMQRENSGHRLFLL